MTKKERVKAALEHKTTDFCPYHISFTKPAFEKISRALGTKEVNAAIGNHINYLRPAFPWREVRTNIWQDMYGIGWDRSVDKDVGVAVNTVINSAAELDRYRFPELKDEYFAGYAANLETNKDLYNVNYISFTLFERAWSLRGMENLLCDMAADPVFVEVLLDKIMEFNLKLVDKLSEYKFDALRFGDDWGQQKGLIMGPEIWRKMIKPRAKILYDRIHAKGMKVFIHCCGDVDELFQDMIEIGVDVFNPFQPEAYDIYKAKKEYGGKLSFFGGLSIQKTMPFGSQKEVKEEARKLLGIIGANGGYILSPSHDLPGDVPVENIIALIETTQKQG